MKMHEKAEPMAKRIVKKKLFLFVPYIYLCMRVCVGGYVCILKFRYSQLIYVKYIFSAVKAVKSF